MKLLTIGTSLITRRFLDAVKQVKGVEHVAVYSRSLEKAREFVSGVHHFDNLDEALNSDVFDTVYIASPNSLHYSQAKQALLANKHVICEKPFVSTKDQLIELIEIASSRELFLFEAITTLHLPNYQIIKENLDRVGQVKIINCNFSQYSSRYQLYMEKQQTNIFDPAFDGGALRDINVYNIHFVLGLFGMPESYTYYANRGYNKVDTSGVLLLQYKDFVGVLIGAKDSSSESYGIIQGESGTIEVSDSSLGRCQKVEFRGHIMDNQKEAQVETLSIDQTHHMSYELEVFKEMVETRDFMSRDQYLNHSLNVVEILEKAGEYDQS